MKITNRLTLGNITRSISNGFGAIYRCSPEKVVSGSLGSISDVIDRRKEKKVTRKIERTLHDLEVMTKKHPDQVAAIMFDGIVSHDNDVCPYDEELDFVPVNGVGEVDLDLELYPDDQQEDELGLIHDLPCDVRS